MTANTYGRQVVVPLTNKSGGGVIAGDVVYLNDGSNADSFTTGTTTNRTGGIGIAQETIADNGTGRILVGGYAALVNVNASVTIGHYGATYSVAKEATDAGASRAAGTFCQFQTGGTTPDAIIWQPDLGAAGGITRTQLGTTTIGGSFDTTLKTILKKVTLSADGFLASIAVGIKGQSTAGFELTAFVMSDNSGAPLNLVALGGSVTRTFATAGGGVAAHTHQLTAMGLINGTSRFVTVAVGAWLAAGDYWIGIVNNANSGNDVQLAFTGSGSDWTGSGTDGPYDQSVASYASGSNNYSLFANILR